MFLVGSDVEGLRVILENAMAQGNEWVVFPTDKMIKERENISVFSKETDAENFCFIHGSLHTALATDKVSTLLQGINDLTNQQAATEGIEYYFFVGDEVFTNKGKLPLGAGQSTSHTLTLGMVQDLLSYPFKELADEKLAGKLMNQLQNYGEVAVEVERSMVPAHHIDSYSLVRHHYPSGGTIYEQHHGLETIGQFRDFVTAKQSFLESMKTIPENYCDIILLGQYQGKGLRYDVEGNCYPSHGYRAAMAYLDENVDHTKEYKAYLSDDPRLATSIREQVKVSLDEGNNKLYLTDVFGNERQLDKFFWRENLTQTENLISLTRQLDHLQFGDLAAALEQHFWQNSKSFTLTTNKDFEEDTMQYVLHLQREKSGFFSLNKYLVTLQKAISINQEINKGVDSKTLEALMKKIDWTKKDEEIPAREANQRKQIKEDLQQLSPKTRVLLKIKCWANAEENLSDREMEIAGVLNRLNRYNYTVHCKNRFDAINATEIYQGISKYSEEMERLLDLSSTTQYHSNLKNTTMDNKNLEYLKNSLKYSGFGEDLNGQLEAKMSSNVPEFTLQYHKEQNNRHMDAVLHFRKGNEGDMYFFNKYDVTLIKPNSHELHQTFYMDKNNSFTAKEAFNLLDGRAVYKDLMSQEQQPYTAWIKLDFTKQKDNGNYEVNRYSDNYGYDLVVAVERLKPKEILDEGARQQLFKSLQRGNAHEVTLESGDKILIAAHPESGKSNKLLKYELDGREITVEMRNVPTNAINQNQNGKDSNKGKKNDASPDEETTEKTSKKKQRVGKQSNGDDNGLLPKKREGSPSKGQRV